MPAKDKILEAALLLFSENGYNGTSVEEIAAGIGIKAPSLYKHFIRERGHSECADRCRGIPLRWGKE